MTVVYTIIEMPTYCNLGKLFIFEKFEKDDLQNYITQKKS